MTMLKLLTCVCVLGLALGAANAREVPVTIIHTTDLAGHILPNENARGTKLGGLLACASVIERFRQRTENTLLVDCGNLVVGSLESRVTNGRIVMDAINSLGYDAWVPGLHDWDRGMSAFDEFYQRSKIPMLGANISVKPGRPNKWTKIQPHIIKEVDGVRVAIVGLTAPTVPLWHHPAQLGDMLFLNSVDALHAALPAVRLQNPDITILIANQGLLPFDDQGNQIREIMRLFPEFDVVLGGQTGQIISERILNGRIYSQAGSRGHAVGRVDLVYDTVTRNIIRSNAQIMEISEQEEALEGLQSHLEDQVKMARTQAKKQIGVVDKRMDGWIPTAGQTPLQRLLTRAMAENVNAEAAFHAMMTKSPLYEGPVVYQDLWRIVPYDSAVCVLSLNVEQLDVILEENAAYMKKPEFMGVHGLAYDLDVKAPLGQRISNIRMANGAAIHPKKLIKVAFDSLLLSSAGGTYPQLRKISEQPTARLTTGKHSVREALALFFRKNSPIKAAMYE
ncbi:MAG: bifunctional metallophosphatase/5'-nucleotidase [Spartobacteria bacterium]|nr:bifunctional metallophosphatase/5'-nucleotidase [Spartobacteria bacterium]